MKKKKIGFIYSWTSIVIMFFLFFPIGIVLLIARLKKDKLAALTGAKVVKVLGWIFIFMALVFITGREGEGASQQIISGAIMFAGPGIVLLITASRMKKKAERMKKYIALIVNGHEYKLENIATATKYSYDLVRKDLQEMIDGGYLTEAYINEATKELIFNNQPTQNTHTTMKQETTSHTGSSRVAACPCCGANNMIAGDIGECEFCGSKVTA